VNGVIYIYIYRPHNPRALSDGE